MKTSKKADQKSLQGGPYRRPQPVARRPAKPTHSGPASRSVSKSKSPAKAQAQFLDDIRDSLRDMKEGKVLPADDALDLIEEGLGDDEIESRLPQ